MSLDLEDPIAVLLAVSRAFRDAGLEAAAYGGLVLAAYGEPRETKDADLAVLSARATPWREALERARLDAQVAFERVQFGGNLITRITLLGGDDASGLNTVDLVEPRSPRYAAIALGRAVEGSLRGESLRLVTPEDFVLLKLLSTRDRDLEDAASVIGRGGVDLELVRAEAATLAIELTDHDLSGRLARLLP